MNNRAEPGAIHKIACVGTGTVGAGWVAYFLSRGLEVCATDPAVDAEARLAVAVDAIWPALRRLGLSQNADIKRLSFTTDIAKAVGDAEFVQESAPDDEVLKVDLLARIDASAPPQTVIASSSSQFLPTRLAARCAHPERVVVGHPFVPSYLVPLVEVVGGERTQAAVMDWAVGFYEHIGKKVLRLGKEIEWYVANRLQVAVFEEASKIVTQGVCEFDDIDTAMTNGPGLRWAFAGPALCYHLGGGRGGVRHMLEHFGWRGPDELKDKLVAAVERMVGDTDMQTLEAWRDENLLTLLGTIKRV